MKTVTVTGNELKDGMVICLHGFIFTVKNPRIEQCSAGPINVVRFEGICTDDKSNDSIRHSSYNGGTYGQLAHLTYTVAST